MITQPMWYETRKHVDFPVEEHRIKHSPLGNEMSVEFHLCGKDYYVIIPTYQWDEANSTIPAEQVGEIDGMVLVCFPATSLGTYTLNIPKSCLESMFE